jgi:hypothetical protein
MLEKGRYNIAVIDKDNRSMKSKANRENGTYGVLRRKVSLLDQLIDLIPCW